MQKSNPLYDRYVEIIHKELVPAMGCTEPIAISYCAAKAREVLGCMPEAVTVTASGNLIKNVKSVIVPNTAGLKGIEAAAAVGIIAGNSARLLEVISSVTPAQKEETRKLVDSGIIDVKLAEGDIVFDLTVEMKAKNDTSRVRIIHAHTNIALIQKNEEVLFKQEINEEETDENPANEMTVADILDFARTCDVADVHDVIAQQISYNEAIAEEGMNVDWGANIGKVFMKNNPQNIRTRIVAMAAAGSDARMSGCSMPVVINSGSGNQGLTITVPIVEYAKHVGSTEEELYRALIFANLIALHQKSFIGYLSAYCGAVSAGISSVAGIAFLLKESDEVIVHTIVNGLAISSGIICDGAKPSCAGKIAASLQVALTGYDMARDNQQFYSGEGIVKKGIENTIRNVGRLGRYGMRETDKEILRIMTGC